MAGPTNLEQLLLEYINEARIDPLGDAARFISSYVPAHSNNADVQNALSFFGVDGSQLMSALSSLTPVQPLAWNDSLGNASRQHSQLMITDDSQEHQLPGEASFDQRDAAAGYTNASFGGENIFASATSDLEAQAAFMIDWGPGPGGMQSPAGHRTNIMSSSFRELGVGIVQDSSPTANAGPLSITEDFGARFNSGAFILGVAYNDTDHDNFYSVGEGLGNLVVSIGNNSVTSWASGGYTLNTTATGTQTITFSGAGLSGNVTATIVLKSTTNDMFDVVNGNTIETSNSASVGGAFTTLEGLGATGLQLAITDGSAHAIIGTKANDTITGGSGDDTITGGAGNDMIDGSGGTNWAVFSGTKGSYAVNTSGTTTTVSGADGTDTVTNIAFLQFADGTTNLGNAGGLIALGSAPQTVTGSAGNTIVGGNGTAVINATSGPETVVGGSGAMTVFGGVGDSIIAGSGSTYVDGSNGGMTIGVGSGGSDTFIGAVAPVSGAGPDTLLGGVAFGGAATVLIQGLGKGDIVNFSGQTGTAFINATAGNIPVTLGSGFAAVYGGNGDTITMATGNQLATDFEGGALIMVGSAGTDSVVGSVARGSGIGATTVIGGAANVIVQGLGSGDIVNFAKQTGTAAINALSGNDSITLGTGAATVFAGAGSTVNFGTGNQYAQGLAGGVTFNVGGAGGSDTIIGSGFPVAGAGVDTLVGGAASVLIQGLGNGDIVNFAKQSSSAAINATAGNNAITLGSGAATVFAGAGDTITAGTGNQYIETLAAPGALVNVGAAGTTSVVGSAAGGVPVTVKGGAGSLIYTPGSGNTFVDLTGSTGTAVINGLGPDVSAINDTIIASNGGTTVFGGSGNRIGVGTGASGSDQFFHSTMLKGASIGFGTNGSAGSSAHVTVTGFAETGGNATDFLFYQGETGGATASIVTGATQTGSGGSVSTVLTLPDGTMMTLAGVAKADFNAGFFK